MLRRQKGFSLVEMLVVVVLLAILIPALLSAFTASYVMIKEARMLEIAKHVGQTVMERSLSDTAATTMPGFESFSAAFPNFSYRRVFEFNASTGRTTITVIVRYPFLTQGREYRTVAMR